MYARILAAATRSLCLLLLSLASAAVPAQTRWLDAAGRPDARAAEALALLQDAGDEGLVPAHYGAAALAGQAQALSRGDADPAQQQAFGQALDRGLARYLHDLHHGRVDARRLGFRLPPHQQQADPAEMLPRVLEGAQPLGAAARGLAPSFSQYRLLRETLARYRALAADASLVLPPLPAATVRPGEALPAAAALGRLLIALGDLPPGAAHDPARYDDTLAEGVRRFQARHGLAPDGLLGKGTRAALAAPLQQRVRQIELAMERMRWLRPRQGSRFIALNIPTFRLWAWDPADRAGTAPLAMDVIVGKALNTRTPALQADMRHVVFRPYWNVPRSILLGEALPKIRKNPAWLQREQMEIVRGGGDDAQPLPPTAANLQLLAEGQLRLRQRPGPHNALGLVKFIFPNEDNVYLHGTPAQALFGRARRDFSHGCVRLQDPVAMAQWVLREQPQWTRERIEAAMAAEQPQTVWLQQPIPVLLFYTTAFLAPGSGQLHFAEDIYGHDRRLHQALQAP